MFISQYLAEKTNRLSPPLKKAKSRNKKYVNNADALGVFALFLLKCIIQALYKIVSKYPLHTFVYSIFFCEICMHFSKEHNEPPLKKEKPDSKYSLIG